MTATLLELRTRSRQRSDMENSEFVSNSELNGYINSSIAELHDILAQAYGTDYFVIPHAFSTTSGEDEYELPEDFYKLHGVDAAVNGTDFINLKRFNFNERNNNSTMGAWNALGIPAIRYRIVGGNITFSPVPDTNTDIKIWYTPVATVLVDDADELNDFNQYSEYVVVDAAIKMLQKEESDVSVLMAQKQALLQRITAASQNRDAGDPESVSDIYAENDEFYSGR